MEKPVKKRRSQERYKIRRLPPPLHSELDERLNGGNFGSYEQVSAWLESEHGVSISPSSLNYYQKYELDPTLRAVRIATAQAAEIVRSAGDDDSELNLAMFRLTQTAIFDLLIQLNKTRSLVAMIPATKQRSANRLSNRQLQDPGTNSPAGAATSTDDPPATAIVTAEQRAAKFPSKPELAAVTALGKIVATVSRANREWREWREKMRERVEAKVAATNASVAEAAREGGLSPAAEQKIRAALMEIKL